jgi:hypothetical protein
MRQNIQNIYVSLLVMAGCIYKVWRQHSVRQNSYLMSISVKVVGGSELVMLPVNGVGWRA